MTLAVLKHGWQWDFMAQMFSLKGPSIERMKMKFIDIVSLLVYENYVELQAKKWKMAYIEEKNVGFKNFPMARYATDVTFEQSFRPSESVGEGKLYFSRRYKFYGHKTEISVLRNGLAIGCRAHKPESVSDLNIFEAISSFHGKQLRKKREVEMEDEGPLRDELSNVLAVLYNKVYYRAHGYCGVIYPQKKAINGTLTPGEISQNRHISSDRIIVENVFGRLCGLWKVMT